MARARDVPMPSASLLRWVVRTMSAASATARAAAR